MAVPLGQRPAATATFQQHQAHEQSPTRAPARLPPLAMGQALQVGKRSSHTACAERCALRAAHVHMAGACGVQEAAPGVTHACWLQTC